MTLREAFRQIAERRRRTYRMVAWMDLSRAHDVVALVTRWDTNTLARLAIQARYQKFDR